MQFLKTILASIPIIAVALAADVCPGTYCTIGQRCGYQPDGPHCCGANDDKNVLQCVNGKWALRNRCGNNQFCTCTGSKDLVCRTNSLAAAQDSTSGQEETKEQA